MLLSTFLFFKNTPINDFVNTIHFSSNQERDIFFLSGGHYETVGKAVDNYNFIRDKSHVRLSMDKYSDFIGVNYCTFFSSFENIRYYAFVSNIKYNNDKTVDIDLIIDVIMTFTQGNVLENLNNLTIEREHLTKEDYKKYLSIIRTNDDILQTYTKKYIHQNNERLSANWVLFQCSIDLKDKFGTTEKVEITTSEGGMFDKLVSPVNLYLCEYNRFIGLMGILKTVPWIAQNISKIMMVPIDFIDKNMIEDVTINGGGYTVQKLKDGGKSNEKKLNGISYTIEELCYILDINMENELHLFRDGYTTIEMYSWDGQSVLLNGALLDEKTGLQLQSMSLFGYQNEIRIFPLNYSTSKSEEDIYISGDAPILYKGTFLNNAFIFNDFTELPLLIDNYKLSLANTSNMRELQNSRQVSSRLRELFNPNLNINDMKNGDYTKPVEKFYNASSLFSNLSIGGIMGKFSDEYDYYNNMFAQQADMALSTPTITQQTKGNSFQQANDIYGITLKISAPDKSEMDKLRKYYNVMGFKLDFFGSKLSKLDSMTICNYLKFKGNYILDGVPVEFMEMMKPLFENGVRFWHNNNTANPMQQDILNNKMR